MNLLLSGARKVMLSSVQKSRFFHDPTFFNRKKEIGLCVGLLNSRPTISVFTGPPDSGKTALLRHVLDQQGKDRPILSIDMREKSFSDVPTFLASMEKSLEPWCNSMKKLLNSAVVKIPYAEFDLATIYSAGMTPKEKLETLFTFIRENTPNFRVWSGRKFPIFFIDEANKMANLTKSEGGPEVLKMFLDFLVKCTKQDRRFHVLLASSDSFYQTWLSQFLGTNRFNTFVVGNLPKDDAQIFWKESLCDSDQNPPSFEEAFSVCGGNILLLQQYVLEYDMMKGNLLPEDFEPVVNERSRLMGALCETDGWSETILLDVMHELTESENGFITYDNLCAKVTRDVVNSMIKANLIHMRPTNKYTYDIEGAPCKAIVTAESPASSAAMKIILEEKGKK